MAAPLPRVLVVEDESEFRQVVRDALSGCEVIEAVDAEGALDLLVVGAVDLVITDIVLPRMDGCALAARVRDRWPETPVVAVSGYLDDRDVIEFDFDAFLDKPVEVHTLRRLVKDLLAKGAS